MVVYIFIFVKEFEWGSGFGCFLYTTSGRDVVRGVWLSDFKGV